MENNINGYMNIIEVDSNFFDDATSVNLEKSFHIKDKHMEDVAFFSGVYYKDTKDKIYIFLAFSNDNRSIAFSINSDRVLNNIELENFLTSDTFKNALLNLLKKNLNCPIINKDYKIITKKI